MTEEDNRQTFSLEKVTDNFSRYEKDFSESRLKEKIKNAAKLCGRKIIYPVLLLWHLLSSGKLSLKDKGMIIGALGYFILPADFIPDVLAGIGFTDDAAVIMFVLKTLSDKITDRERELANKDLERIFG